MTRPGHRREVLADALPDRLERLAACSPPGRRECLHPLLRSDLRGRCKAAAHDLEAGYRPGAIAGWTDVELGAKRGQPRRRKLQGRASSTDVHHDNYQASGRQDQAAKTKRTGPSPPERTIVHIHVDPTRPHACR